MIPVARSSPVGPAAVFTPRELTVVPNAAAGP